MRPHSLIFVLLLISFSGCGVKAPPIAPERPRPDERKLDCSTDDPECERTDPNYKPKGK